LRQLLTERYRERLAGVLSCYDRIICAADPGLRLSAMLRLYPPLAIADTGIVDYGVEAPEL
jgi:hypothetical protein